MLQTIEDLSIGVWVRESPSIFAYTLVLSLHAIGLAIVLGLNWLIALRLLGVAKAIPLTALRSFYGTIWFGFVINAVSGVLLFIASATNMGVMHVFWIKMAAVATGMIVSLRLKARYLNDPAAPGGRHRARRRAPHGVVVARCLVLRARCGAHDRLSGAHLPVVRHLGAR